MTWRVRQNTSRIRSATWSALPAQTLKRCSAEPVDGHAHDLRRHGTPHSMPDRTRPGGGDAAGDDVAWPPRGSVGTPGLALTDQRGARARRPDLRAFGHRPHRRQEKPDRIPPAQAAARRCGCARSGTTCATCTDRPESEAEIVAMIDEITTNKTEFFREHQHFDFLVSEISAEPARRRTGRC